MSMLERVNRQVGLVSAVLLAAAGVVVCSGCGGTGIEPEWGLAEGSGGSGEGGSVGLTGERWGLRQYAAGEPKELRISPLTRVETDERGEAMLTVHLELVDAWGHSGKWLMLARVEVSENEKSSADEKNGGGGKTVPTAGEARVDLDLTDPAVNAAAFDWITRTYVVRVKNLPTWATQRGANGWVRAAVGWVDVGGERRVLRGAKQIGK